MGRRRALMMAGEAGTKMKDLNAGSEFRFIENGAAYIFLGIINGTAWIFRKSVISGASIMRNDGVYDYENSNIDIYLNSTFYDTFSELQKAVMTETSVTFKASNGSTLIDKTIQRKIFLPTYPQLYSDTNGVLSALKAYYNTTDAGAARKTSYRYWTASARGTSQMYAVNTNGVALYPGLTEANFYRRPIISINKETPVTLINGIYVLA